MITTRMSHRSLLTGLVAATAAVVATAATVTTGPQADAASQPKPITQPHDLVRDAVLDLRSIDPADTDTTDLDGWRRALTGVRVVMLGETTHGDAATFRAKTRLVRFLHDKLGFNVLAFEAGFYDCTRAQQLIDAGADAARTVNECVHGVWSSSQQFQPLTRYIADTTHTANPLRIAGIDTRFSDIGAPGTTIARQHFLTDLDAAATAATSAVRRDAARWKFVTTTADLLLDPEGATFGDPPAEAEQQQRLAAIDALTRDFTRRTGPRARYWAQVTTNLRRYAAFAWTMQTGDGFDVNVLNTRDAAMADNLAWLTRHQHRGQKVIVWAASQHIAANLAATTGGKGPGFDMSQFVSTGQHVRRRLGSQAYLLGVTTYTGTTGIGQTRPITPAPADSLDALLHNAGVNNGLLDFRHTTTPTRQLLAAPRPSYTLGYTVDDGGTTTADWTQQFDGILHIDTMTATTLVPPTE